MRGWQLPHLADELGEVLSARIEELELEQAVRGIDHLKATWPLVA